jgi:hypothetical protein
MSTESFAITIPMEVKHALRIPERELGERLRLELAVHLYWISLPLFEKLLRAAGE